MKVTFEINPTGGENSILAEFNDYPVKPSIFDTIDADVLLNGMTKLEHKTLADIVNNKGRLFRVSDVAHVKKNGMFELWVTIQSHTPSDGLPTLKLTK